MDVKDLGSGNVISNQEFYRRQLEAGDPNAKGMNPDEYAQFAAKTYKDDSGKPIFQVMNSTPPRQLGGRLPGGNILGSPTSIVDDLRYLKDTASNIPSDVIGVGKDIISGLGETLKGGTLRGRIEQLSTTPPPDKTPKGIWDRFKTIASGALENLNAAYGITDGKWNAPEYFKEHPVRTAMDVETAASLGGLLTKGGAALARGAATGVDPITGEKVFNATSLTGKTATALDKTGNVLTKTADAVNPLSVPTRAVQAPIRHGEEWAEAVANKVGTAGGTKLQTPAGTFRQPTTVEKIGDNVADTLMKGRAWAENKYGKALGVPWNVDDKVRTELINTAMNNRRDINAVYRETPGVPYTNSIEDYRKLNREISTINKEYREKPLLDPQVRTATLSPQGFDNLNQQLDMRYSGMSKVEFQYKWQKMIKDEIDRVKNAGLNVEEAYNHLKQMNKELDSFYDKAAKQGADSETVTRYEIKANVADYLRKQIDGAIQQSTGNSQFLRAGKDMNKLMQVRDIIRANIGKFENVPVRDQSGYITMKKAELLTGQGGIGSMYAVAHDAIRGRDYQSKAAARLINTNPPPAPVRRAVTAAAAMVRKDEKSEMPSQRNRKQPQDNKKKNPF